MNYDNILFSDPFQITGGSSGARLFKFHSTINRLLLWSISIKKYVITIVPLGVGDSSYQVIKNLNG
jgi:hypothetical protein